MMCLSLTVFIQVLKKWHFHASYSINRSSLPLILFHITLPPLTEFLSTFVSITSVIEKSNSKICFLDILCLYTQDRQNLQICL